MTFAEKRDAALALLADLGVGEEAAAPVCHRLLWSVGVPVRPPLYQSFAGLLGVFVVHVWLVLAVPVGLTVGLLIDAAAARSAVTYLVPPAALFGLLIAVHYRVEAGRLRLSRWQDVGASQPDEDPGW